MNELSLLEYEVLLAEEEYYTNLISMGSDYINESTGLILLTEDFKDNIKNYIERIIKAIQSAWDKFKNKIIQAPFKKYLDEIKPQVMNWQGSVSVEHFPSTDSNNFNGLSLLQFTPDMLTKYKSKEDIISDNYNFLPNNDKSFKNRCYDYINDKEYNGEINQDVVKVLYVICTKGFPNLTSKLENELTEFNNTIKNIQNNINFTTTSTTTTNNTKLLTTSTEEIATVFESYLMEAEDNGKTKINTDGTAKNPNISKIITGLISINTDIISAKMNYLRNLYMWSIKLLRSLFKASNKNEENNKNNPNNTANKTQVEI